jgi:diguanylate cyclase (GGDEF)-like protein
VTAATVTYTVPALAGIEPAAEAIVVGFLALGVWWLASALAMTALLRVAAGIPVRESPVLRREATLVMWSQLLLGLVLAVLVRISWWYLPLALLAVWWAYRYLGLLRRAVEAEADGRTGLLRYDVLRDAAHREQERSRRTGEPVSLVLFDVDELRAVNLGRGYESGDAVIRGTAQSVRGRARWQDVAARVGGEEYCVLMPGFTVAEAGEFADLVRSDVRETEYATPTGPVRVTLSAGITDLRPHESLDEALARLDLALYDAKGAGLDSLRLRQE